MGSTRFFLADLPLQTTETDLRQLFQQYGHVTNIDLKRKEQEDAGEKVLAFVTLKTDDARYCLDVLNWQQLHGSNLHVSLAKESFLDRLKREREENQQREQEQQPGGTKSQEPESNSQLLKQTGKNKRRVFGEDEEIGDDEVPIELLITKKRASTSMHNGRIVIQQELDVKPLHVIEQHRKPAKQQPDAKVSKAEQKRKESLLKMRQEHIQKKSAIQLALSAGSGQAKRIKFSDAEEEEEEAAKKPPKKDLFDDDDGEDGEDEQIVLPQHKGKKGERLVEMQSKQSLDPRFRITSNFVEGEDDEEEEEEGEEPAPLQESERNWQMGILEQVVGHKLNTDHPDKPNKSKKMLRFDPAKEGHQKLMRQKLPQEDEEGEAAPTSKKATRDTESSQPVSKSAFYVVTDTLKQSLNMRGEGFSLLDMFGSAPDEEVAKRQDQLEKLGAEKILVGKASASKIGLATLNPFSYDSSDSEDGEEAATAPKEEQEQEQGQPKVIDENEAPSEKKAKQKKKPKIKLESFFIPKNDPRLKEGARFFKPAKTEVNHADYDQVRNRLKLLISNKIAKTRKNLPSKDFKQHRNKKAKN
ncbi:hypothetical protein KR009_001943 [Drosophila setifemur]|nr:hypothetical protein KR009_001943 [Drosophila setifemur]